MPLIVQILLTGIAIGLLVAAPIGPVNVLCIQRTLSRGFLAGVASGLGAVIGDGLLAAVAAFGITAVTSVMETYGGEIQLFGAIVLIAFGARLLFYEPDIVAPPPASGLFIRQLGLAPQTFALTVTNPGAILGMLAIVGGVGSAIRIETVAQAGTLVVGVMLGSLLWWFILAWLISTIRHRLTQSRLKLINRIAGALLMVFGALLLLDLMLPGGL